VQYERLTAIARSMLNDSAKRVMAVLDPIRIVVSGLKSGSISTPDFPQSPEKGSHSVPVEESLFIDKQDFRLVDSDVR